MLLVIANLVGCGRAKYEDVSHQARYSALINKQYRTRVALPVLGITDDRNYRQVIDYYLLTGTPSISGPEVVTRVALSPGSLVQPLQVMICTNCVGSVIRIVVKINSGEDYADKPVFVPDIGDLITTSADGRSITLNPLIFEPNAN